MNAKEKLGKSLEDVLIQNPELSEKYDEINHSLFTYLTNHIGK
jgi:hypothetical protein